MSAFRLAFLLPFRPALAREISGVPASQLIGLLVFCALWFLLQLGVSAWHLSLSNPARMMGPYLGLLLTFGLALLRDVLLFPVWSRWFRLPVDRRWLWKLLVLRITFLVFVVGLLGTVETLVHPAIRSDLPITVALATLAGGSPPPFYLEVLRSGIQLWMGIAVVAQLSVLTGHGFWKVLLVGLPYAVLASVLSFYVQSVVRIFQGLPVEF